MKASFLNLGSLLFENSVAVGSDLLNTFNSNLRQTFESFEPVNDRIYKAEFGNPHTDIFDSLNSGFCIDGINCISKKQSRENMLLIGATGAGKSSVVILNSCVRMKNSSLVIHDPSSELHGYLSGWLQSQGYKVYVIKFSEPHNSHSYNPMDYVFSQADCQKLAAQLVRTVLQSKGEPFWGLQATSLIAILIGILLTQEKKYRNFQNVYHLLANFQGTKLDGLFSKYASDSLFAEYKSFRAYDQKLLSNITATCKAALQIFANDNVAKATATSTIDFAQLRKQKSVVFIQNQTSESHYYSGLISVLFEQLMDTLLAKLPDESDLDLYLILDEVATICPLPSLPLFLTNGRKYRVGTLHCWQNQQIITHAFGSYLADSIINNSFVKLFLGGGISLTTAQELEQMLGKTEVANSDGQKMVKSLMFCDEIRQMPNTEAIAICGAHKPYKLHLTPFYKQKSVTMKMSKYPPVKVINESIKNVSLIPIPKGESNEAK